MIHNKLLIATVDIITEKGSVIMSTVAISNLL